MNMVEKVAKAIYEADDAWSAAFPWPSMGSPDQSADNYRRIARAAIEAMREPTEFMLSAIYEKGSDTFEYDNVGYGFIEHIWGAGIAAALSEESTS